MHKNWLFGPFMVKKLLFTAVLVFLFLFAEVAVGEVSIGVKSGDWIEYKVSTTGLPPEGHDVVWARMEILSVVGGEIRVNTTTKAANGTFSSVVMTLNPAAGQVDVWAIIPANLSQGDSFFDKNLGKIPIMGQEQKTIGGAVRDTTFYNSTERFKRWDKTTGVFLEGTDALGNYSLTATFERTNIWSSKIMGLDPTVFFISIFAVALLAAGFMAIVVVRRKSLKTKIG